MGGVSRVSPELSLWRGVVTAAVFESPPSVAGWEEVSETGQVRGDDDLEAGAKSSSLSRVREAPAAASVRRGVGRYESGPGFLTHTVRPVPCMPPGHGPGAQGPAGQATPPPPWPAPPRSSSPSRRFASPQRARSRPHVRRCLPPRALTFHALKARRYLPTHQLWAPCQATACAVRSRSRAACRSCP